MGPPEAQTGLPGRAQSSHWALAEKSGAGAGAGAALVLSSTVQASSRVTSSTEGQRRGPGERVSRGKGESSLGKGLVLSTESRGL